MKRLVIATRNKGKLREFLEILRGLPYEVVSLADYPDAPEVEETGATFAENAIIKATAAARYTGELSLADDSGLEVDALGGAPGVQSARYAPTTDDRNAKVLGLLRDVADPLRTARFRCVIAIASPDGHCLGTYDGAVEGSIAREPRGNQGFGYDPIFYVTEAEKHMAELDSAQKNLISHRARAMARAKNLLARIMHEAHDPGSGEHCSRSS